MIKILLMTLFLFFPLTFGSFSNNFSNNNPVLQEKVPNRSAESDSFLTYWKEDFRKDDNGQIIPICDITYASYTVMYGKYVELSSSDREIVNNTPDYEEGYLIKDSIKQLISIHSNHTNPKSNERQTLNQQTTIIIIVVVAVFGMSTICVFFVKIGRAHV